MQLHPLRSNTGTTYHNSLHFIQHTFVCSYEIGVFIDSFDRQSSPELEIGDILIKIYISTQEYSVEFASHEEIKRILENTTAPFDIEVIRPTLPINNFVDFVMDSRKFPWLLSYLHQEVLDEDPKYYEVSL